MIKEKAFRRKAIIFTVLAALVLELLSSVFIMSVRAEETVQSYDVTDINGELEAMGIDVSRYPRNDDGEAEVVSLMEYCFTQSESNIWNDKYNLFFYVYNPTGKPIKDISEMNFITVAIGDENFDKIELVSLGNTNNHLFYKLKVIDTKISDVYKSAHTYAQGNGGERKYVLSELQLKHENADTYVSSDVSFEYRFSGYSSWCDDNNSEVSTLTCTNYSSKSIHLNVDYTNYRFDTQSDGKTQYDMSSVYFSVPEEYFTNYGDLSSIKAEWYEYKTAPMFVTENQEAYEELLGVLGIEIDPYGFAEAPKYQIYENGVKVPNIDTRIFWNIHRGEGGLLPDGSRKIEYEVYNGYNVYRYGQSLYNSVYKVEISFSELLANKDLIDTQIAWLFCRKSVETRSDWEVSKDELLEYMKWYSSKYGDTLIRDKYSEDLFINEVDDSRIVGHNSVVFTDIEKDVEGDFISIKQSFWDKLFNRDKEYEGIEYSPIEVIEYPDLNLTDKEFSKKYFVNMHDVADVKSMAKTSYKNDETPVLLRFAITDYVSYPAIFDSANTDLWSLLGSENGYVAEETVFLDFDVISLGFTVDGGTSETIIGVVANPIDIIHGLTAPESMDPEKSDWWQKIMMVLMIILFAVFVWPIISPFITPIITVLYSAIWGGIKSVIRLAFKTVTFPFRLLFRLIFPK